jgi:hypothetical protein
MWTRIDALSLRIRSASADDGSTARGRASMHNRIRIDVKCAGFAEPSLGMSTARNPASQSL